MKQSIKKIRRTRSAAVVVGLAALLNAFALVPANAGTEGGTTISQPLPNAPSAQVGGIFTPGLRDASFTASVYGEGAAPSVEVSRTVPAGYCAEGFSGVFALIITGDYETATVSWVVTGTIRMLDGTTQSVPIGSGSHTVQNGSEGDSEIFPVCLED